MSEQDNYSDNNSDDDFFNYSDGDEDSEEQSDEDVKSEESDDLSFLDTPAKKTPKREAMKQKKDKVLYPPKNAEDVDERISANKMSPFEYAALIGARAEMIAKGAKIHPKSAKVDTVDLIKIAEMELNDPDIPFPLMIERTVDHPMDGHIKEVFIPHENGYITPKALLVKDIEKYIPPNPWQI